MVTRNGPASRVESSVCHTVFSYKKDVFRLRIRREDMVAIPSERQIHERSLK